MCHLKNHLKLFVLTVFIALVLMSCADPRFEIKELIVRNNTTYPIIGLIISFEVGDLDTRGEFLPTIIAPGAEKSFAIPSPVAEAFLAISNRNDDVSIRFTYDHLVNGKNEAIIATLNEEELECTILLDGSNVEVMYK